MDFKINPKLAYYILLMLFGLNFVCYSTDAQRSKPHPHYYSECGESPLVKYIELAKSIGWEVNQLIRFIKFEKPADYEILLRSVKQYADCVALAQSPI